ncbi:hypothetical protein [Pararhizobium haloflavum]|uniref:hypothetical protein n=1 Tax=Pararhizobium haloflavum TaxID=2037914 RepID=UPI000C19EEF5|nr:hypothetical protein [Pararhizobium haloflavum]
MTRRAVIDGGIVVNIIEAGPDFELPGKTLVDAGNASIGWTWDGEAFMPPPALEPPVPEIISDRQFFQGLALRGEISEAEALDAVGSGAIPAAMSALIEQLPEAERFPARMLVRGATTFLRSHPLADLIGQLYGWNASQIDEFWRECALL